MDSTMKCNNDITVGNKHNVANKYKNEHLIHPTQTGWSVLNGIIQSYLPPTRDVIVTPGN